MSNPYLYWITVYCCAFGVACDDETQAENRVPQIEIGGTSSAGDESPSADRERTFVFTPRESTLKC